MMGKKIGVLFIAMLSFSLMLSLISLASANLEIQKEAVSSQAIRDLNLPAVFNLHLTNLGDGDTFKIYSIAGADIQPNDSFTIGTNAEKDITLLVYPTVPLKTSPDYYSFEYKIKGDNSGLQADELAISMVNFRDAFDLTFDSINPDSVSTTLTIANRGGHLFDKISMDISSDFFTKTIEFSLGSLESKTFSIDLDRNKMAKLFAGPYIVNFNIKYGDFETQTTKILKFEEKPGITTTESNEGVLARRAEVVKKNDGNVAADVTVVVTRNFFTSLFTSFNILPTKKETQGLVSDYYFQKTLSPGESLDVIANTNWWVFLAVLVLIGFIIYLFDNFVRNKIVIIKKVYPVRTKGGEFALRVSIKVKARDFVEKIRIFDRLPPMVKIFEKYGLTSPDRVDNVNKRLEWTLQALGKGEEREYSYIVYSKIGVVGKFELPQAEAIYEFNGRIKEVSSNRAIYNNEKK